MARLGGLRHALARFGATARSRAWKRPFPALIIRRLADYDLPARLEEYVRIAFVVLILIFVAIVLGSLLTSTSSAAPHLGPEATAQAAQATMNAAWGQATAQAAQATANAQATQAALAWQATATASVATAQAEATSQAVKATGQALEMQLTAQAATQIAYEAEATTTAIFVAIQADATRQAVDATRQAVEVTRQIIKAERERKDAAWQQSWQSLALWCAGLALFALVLVGVVWMATRRAPAVEAYLLDSGAIGESKLAPQLDAPFVESEIIDVEPVSAE